MQGFIRRSIPLVVRRLVTMTPALVVLAIGARPDASHWWPARWCCPSASRSRWCRWCCSPAGATSWASFANARATTVAASVVAGLIIALNLFLRGQDVRGLRRPPVAFRPGTRRGLPVPGRRAPARLDPARGGPADRRRGPLHRGGHAARPDQRDAVLEARLALAAAFGAGVRARGRARDGARARSRCSTTRASPGKLAFREARSGRVEVTPDVGPARVGAPGVRPPPGAVARRGARGAASAPICCSARSCAGALTRPATRWWRRATRPTCRWWT